MATERQTDETEMPCADETGCERCLSRISSGRQESLPACSFITPWPVSAGCSARSALPLPCRTRLGAQLFHPRPGRPGQPTLVILVGRCSPCLADTLKKLDQLSRSNKAPNVVVVSDADVKEIQSFWKQSHLEVPAVADVDGRLSLQDNAAWKPHGYLIDPDAVSRWCQPDNELDLNKVTQIAKGGYG